MKDSFVVSKSCGEKCSVNDVCCKNCSYSLSHSEVWKDQIIDGIDSEELKKRIGKNADYYTEKFAKKKKKWFIQFNFAALIFGPAWFFYRKMYKIGILYTAIFLLLSSLLTVLVPTVLQKDVDQYYAAKKAYTNYVNSDREQYIWGEGEYSSYLVGLHPDYQEVTDNLKAAQNKIRWIDFLMSAPVLIINILIRLFANSIYKNHIASTPHSGDYGVSVKSAVVSFVATYVVAAGVAILLDLIPVVSRFSEAANSLMSWL